MKLKWKSVENATGYKIQIKKNSLKRNPIVDLDLGNKSDFLLNADHSTLYFWKIVPYNKYHEMFGKFKRACKSFYRHSNKHKDGIFSLSAEHFR